jgi:hypothetical protein
MALKCEFCGRIRDVGGALARRWTRAVADGARRYVSEDPGHPAGTPAHLSCLTEGRARQRRRAAALRRGRTR